AAERRLDEHQSKLRALPGGLPEQVVVPRQLVTVRKRGGRIVGYAMDRVPRAELLYRYSEPRLRKGTLSGDRVVAVLRDLHQTVVDVHRAGVVIGDFNDLNVLISGGRAYLIDSDSFQFGPYLCRVFSPRFVDPLLCDPGASALLLREHHRASSDWYAFAVMVMRSLLCVGPYGGVYRPADRTRRVAHDVRPLRRITVFDPEVIYPRPALHYGVLADDLLDYFRRTFIDDQRGPFPDRLLDDMRWTRCRACGAQHARTACPACAGKNGKRRVFSRVRGQLAAESVVVCEGVIAAAALGTSSDGRPANRGHPLRFVHWHDGALRNAAGQALLGPDGMSPTPTAYRRIVCHGDGALVIEPGRVWSAQRAGRAGAAPGLDLLIDSCPGDALSAASVARTDRHLYWLRSGRLWRDDILGEVVLGEVLRGHTWFWVGRHFGLGMYRVGAMTVGFTFDSERPGIADNLRLPHLRGALLAARCALGADRAWLSWTEIHGGRTRHRCVLIVWTGRTGRSAELIARADPDDDGDANGAWLAGLAGACAVGPYLFVPSDRGVVRVEADGERLRVTRSFPDTEPFVDAGSTLLVGASGLYAVHTRRIVHLQLR
ncbi:MAG: hypothetical protein AAGC55_19575, partial [Myxococcota bacterium]